MTEKTTDVDPPSQDEPSLVLGRDLGFLLGVVFRSYVKAANVVIDAIPGGSRGYEVLSAAARGEVESQSGLAQRLGVDRTVMTYLLDDLEKAGLVVRRPDPRDRRNRHVLATPEGSRLWAATELRLRRLEDRVLDGLSAEEQDTMRDLLCRVAGRALASDPVEDACTVLNELAAEPDAPQAPTPGR